LLRGGEKKGKEEGPFSGKLARKRVEKRGGKGLNAIAPAYRGEKKGKKDFDISMGRKRNEKRIPATSQ